MIITGGAGYIGSHVCKALAQNDFIPICFDNLSQGHEWAVKWGPLEIGDILDSKQLDRLFHEYTPCAVIHLAGFTSVGESIANPIKFYQNNVVGTLALLDKMKTFGVNKLIFSSSCATYGTPVKIPIDESHTQDPINPYGSTKLIIEKILRDFSEAYDIRSVSLRYFNAAGADPEGVIGECHDPETHLIPLILQTAAGLHPQIEIYGNDYDTPDGTCIRDYIHVTDLADAHIKSLLYLLHSGETTAFNIGNETGISVMEILQKAEKITGENIEYKIVARRPGDAPCLIADSKKIKKELGWKAKYSKLHDILSSAWKWQFKHN